MRNRKYLALALAGLVALAGCAEDDDSPVAPNPPVSEIFDRYVALGNSITAGYQSSGINDSTQQRAYPVLVAQQAGATFNYPRLNRAPDGGPGGCPPPLALPLRTATVDTLAAGCSLRAPTFAPVQNLAVPGAAILSGTDNAIAANALTTFILGGRSQAEAMREMQPTLVSVWLGNNDALGAALSGNPQALTSLEVFTAAWEALEADIESTPAAANDAVVVFGVVNPAVVAALQPGAFAFIVKSNPATAPLLPKDVSPNCSPVTATGQPNPLARNLVSLQVLNVPQVAQISCADDAPFVLTPAEQTQISTRVAQYNQLLQGQAQANGWIYIDPNALLLGQIGDPSALRKCQGLATAATLEQLQAAVLNTCPSIDPAVGFGSLLSYDGVHPTTRAHRIIANAMIEALNAKFSLAIPALTL